MDRRLEIALEADDAAKGVVIAITTIITERCIVDFGCDREAWHEFVSNVQRCSERTFLLVSNLAVDSSFIRNFG